MTEGEKMKPYGATSRIPVKMKYSGSNPWKIVVGYRKEGATPCES